MWSKPGVTRQTAACGRTPFRNLIGRPALDLPATPAATVSPDQQVRTGARLIVEIQIPALERHANGFPDHWINILFRGNRPDNWQSHAIVTTYVRLVEGAYAHYEMGRQQVGEVWNNHSRLGIGAHNLSATFFEDCFSSMHRAVLCMERIRGYKEVPDDLKRLVPSRPAFTTPAIADRIRDVRHAVQHMDNFVLKGDIPVGTNFMLTATGPVTPSPRPGQPDQMLKTIDRLVIGDNHVLFSEVVAWLYEMGDCAADIAAYAPEAVAGA